jgi:hypothetical protein
MEGYNISLSLIADSRQMLTNMTIQAQINWGMKLKFRDFAQLKDGSFICWFEIPHAIYVERMTRGKD